MLSRPLQDSIVRSLLSIRNQADPSHFRLLVHITESVDCYSAFVKIPVSDISRLRPIHSGDQGAVRRIVFNDPGSSKRADDAHTATGPVISVDRLDDLLRLSVQTWISAHF
jgi:hypothetical protein